MRILNAIIGSVYRYDDDEDKKREKRLKLLETLVDIGIDLTGVNEKLEYESILVTESQFVDLQIKGVDVTLRGSATVELPRAIDALTTLVEKAEQFTKSIGDVHYNQRCEVYTPGMGLMLFNRVMLLQDACSDSLQTYLDDGWRIVAACPQPDQRRPDYILGRHDPSYNTTENSSHMAARGR